MCNLQVIQQQSGEHCLVIPEGVKSHADIEASNGSLPASVAVGVCAACSPDQTLHVL